MDLLDRSVWPGILATFSHNHSLESVCHNPLCNSHVSVDAHPASILFRQYLKMLSNNEEDALSYADGDMDALIEFPGLTNERVSYLKKFVNRNIKSIGNDPTQQKTEQCGDGVLKQLSSMGRDSVYFPATLHNIFIKIKTPKGTPKAFEDTYQDVVLTIVPEGDILNWLIKIGHIRNSGAVEITRGMILAYHAIMLSLKSPELLGNWPHLDRVVKFPEEPDSIRFAAGLGYADLKFNEYQMIRRKRTGTGSVKEANVNSYLTLGVLSNITKPQKPNDTDFAEAPNVDRAETIKRTDLLRNLFHKTENGAESPLPAVKPLLPAVKHSPIKVILNSIDVMNPHVDPRTHKRLHDMVANYEGFDDFAIIKLPFPLFPADNHNTGIVVATEFHPVPSDYDQRNRYHIVTIKYGDEQNLQLMVVSKKQVSNQVSVLCFLEQSPGGKWVFRHDNVLVWIMSPIKNALKNRTKATKTFERGKQDYTAQTLANLGTDHMAALIVTAENLETMRFVLASEVLKFIDKAEFIKFNKRTLDTPRGKKQLAVLREKREILRPDLEAISKKFRMSTVSYANKSRIYTLLSTWKTEIEKKQNLDADGFQRLDIDNLLFHLACRPVPVVPSSKKAKAAKQKILGVYEQQDLAEYPAGFYDLKRAARVQAQDDKKREESNAIQLAKTVVEMQLTDAVSSSDIEQAGKLNIEFMQISGKQWGTTNKLQKLTNANVSGLLTPLMIGGVGGSGANAGKELQINDAESEDDDDSAGEGDGDDDDDLMSDDGSDDESDDESDSDPADTQKKGKEPAAAVGRADTIPAVGGADTDTDTDSDSEPAAEPAELAPRAARAKTVVATASVAEPEPVQDDVPNDNNQDVPYPNNDDHDQEGDGDGAGSSSSDDSGSKDDGEESEDNDDSDTSN